MIFSITTYLAILIFIKKAKMNENLPRSSQYDPIKLLLVSQHF